MRERRGEMEGRDERKREGDERQMKEKEEERRKEGKKEKLMPNLRGFLVITRNLTCVKLMKMKIRED